MVAGFYKKTNLIKRICWNDNSAYRLGELQNILIKTTNIFFKLQRVGRKYKEKQTQISFFPQ